jgi:hypothetical protein
MHSLTQVAYIDGMPLLMASESRVGHWKDYVYSNFACCVIRFFKMGCEAVVLAFDEYDHVPKAKSITQVMCMHMSSGIMHIVEVSIKSSVLAGKPYKVQGTLRVWRWASIATHHASGIQ